MHQSIPSTNIPPGRPSGFCTLPLPQDRDLYLMTFPGAVFLHIHKITFSTVKKYTFTQLAFGSYLHALHRQKTAKEQCGMKISYLQKISRACLYSYLIRYQIIRHVAFTKPFVPVFNQYIYRICYPSLS